MRTRLLVPILFLFTIVSCTSKPSTPASETNPSTGASQSATPAAGEKRQTVAKEPAAKPAVLPAGTVLTVRTASALGSKISSSGQAFDATVARPVEMDGKVIIPEGARATGQVTEAVPLGRFKGGSRLRVTLDSVTVDGKSYPIQTSSVAEAGKGKGKRTAVMAGGGAAVGALIGGLAGGGKGAAIGAIAGGGAGTAGAAFTGNKDIVLPAESALSFKLEQPLEVKK